MTTDETLEAIYAIARLALLTPTDDVRALLHEIRRMETVMPILDPTGWQRITRTEAGHRELVEVFLVLRASLDSLLVPA